MLSREFYVYEHWRPDKGVPFYVGKGNRRRAEELSCRNKRHRNVVAKLRQLGLAVEIRRVFSGLDEEMAFELEKSQIAYWRSRGITLVNLTPGGEGSAGYKWTEEQRAAVRAWRSAPEVREQMSLRTKEQMARPGVREQLSIIAKAAVTRPEVRAARAAGWEAYRKGPKKPRVQSEAQNKHRSTVMDRPEVQAKHRASLIAAWERNRDARLVASERPEVKEKHRAAVTAWWARRKTQKLENILCTP